MGSYAMPLSPFAMTDHFWQCKIERSHYVSLGSGIHVCALTRWRSWQRPRPGRRTTGAGDLASVANALADPRLTRHALNRLEEEQ